MAIPQQVVLYKPKKKGGNKKSRKMRNALPLNMVVFQGKKKKRRVRSSVPPSVPMKALGQAARQYRLALANPFSPDALGVRAIDSICYPTTVSHIRYKLSCTTSATGGFQMAILPFLHASSIVVAGTATGSPGVYVNNPSVSWSALPANLNDLYTQVRVVTWGARIILTDSNQNAKGTYTIAPVMLGGYVPGPSILGAAAASTAVIYQNFGVQEPNEAIASLPGAVAVNAQDLMSRGELVMRGLPYSVTAYDMKPVYGTNTLWNVNQYVGQPPILQSTVAGAIEYSEGSGLGDARGQIAYLLNAANMPNSTQEFQIEFIYHLEAVPFAVRGNVVTTSTPSPPGSTTAIERVLAGMHTAGEYFTMGTNVAGTLGNLGTKMYQFRKQGRMLGYM